MAIALVWVDLKVTVTVVVVLTMVVDSAVGMDMHNFVAELAWMEDMMSMKMVVVAGNVVDTAETVEVVGFHNHIPSNLVQVVVDIVVEAKLAMALEGSKDYKMDKHNFAEGLRCHTDTYSELGRTMWQRGEPRSG